MSQRGPYARGLAKREEILQTALELFVRKGYDRVSVREIARECGLTQAGLLHYFKTKEELFLEVLRRRDDRNGEAFKPEQTPVERLISAVDRNADESGLVRLFVSMSAESTEEGSAARAFFEERYAWLANEIATDVRLRADGSDLNGTLSPDDVAALLIAAADGLQLQWLLHPDRIQMSRLMSALWSLMDSPESPQHSQD